MSCKSYVVCLCLIWLWSTFTHADQAKMQRVSIAYIDIERAQSAGVPSYLARPSQEGEQGTQLAITDANITGRFIGFELTLAPLAKAPDSPWTRQQQQVIKDAPVILVDAAAEHYAQVVDTLIALNPDALLFNVANYYPSVRSTHCSAKLLHTIPSYQMQTDALGQWFRTKRIKDIFVVHGTHVDDTAHTQAFVNTAKKFKLNIVETKAWQQSFDLRRSAFAEIPPFTRTDDEYQAVFTADADRQFAYSLPFNTHYPVPITGDAGLRALNWHFSHEQWGARQVQNRFKERFGRYMNPVDYASYVAVIAVSTALQQGTPGQGSALYKALLADTMSIAAYKGRKLSFRANTRQLRQPILLAHDQALVTHAPLPGFLHQTNELDTLGTVNQTCQGLSQ